MAAGTIVPLERYLSQVYEPDCDYVDGELQERNVGERTHAVLQLKVGSYLLTHYGSMGMEVSTEIRIRVSPTRYRIPDVCVTIGSPSEEVLTHPPFLCVEILSPEDRMSRVETRIRDFLDMGVNYVWLLDPSTKQAYVATRAGGLREVKDGTLRTTDPALEMPLGGLWP